MKINFPCWFFGKVYYSDWGNEASSEGREDQARDPPASTPRHMLMDAEPSQSFFDIGEETCPKVERTCGLVAQHSSTAGLFFFFNPVLLD